MTSLNNKALLTHAWMTGNLGDVMHIWPIIEYLKNNGYQVDLSGYYPKKVKEWNRIVKNVNNFYQEKVLKNYSVEDRRRLFENYNKVVFIPGPYISGKDKRKTAALNDISIISEMPQVTSVLAGHSFSDLDVCDFDELKKADVIISREISSWDYLKSNGLSSTLAADLAFAYLQDRKDEYRLNPKKVEPLAKVFRSWFDKLTTNGTSSCFNDIFVRPELAEGRNTTFARGSVNNRYLLFLRHDNYDLPNLFEKRDVTFKPMNSNNAIQLSMSNCDFATSDIFRDKPVLRKLCKKYNYKITLCETVKDLYQTISKYQHIITDRYHPAVIGFLLKKEVMCLASKNDTKMSGLIRMIGNSDIEDLIALAKRSLSW